MPTVDQGKLERIEKIQDLPLRMAEAILEGISSKPGDMAVLGMGFFAGYMGYDMVQYMMRPFKEMIGSAGDTLGQIPNRITDVVFPLADLPIEIAAGPLSGTVDTLMRAVGGPAIMPGKRITPATKGQVTSPGVSYYGPAPTGFAGDWPPHGITLAQIQAEIDKDDENKPWWEFELIAAETELKLVCGCMSAIAAYALTRPGAIQGILEGLGSITQGVGEIVPF